MSDETVGGVLRHKDTRNIQVRLDYMLLYRNETKAKVIRIMETWTAQKKAEWYKQSVEAKEQKLEPPEEELWVTMSYEQFSLFAYGTMKHDNIKQNVDDLVKEKHLQRRPHPTIPYGPPQYLLNLKLLQKMLDEQEIPSLVDDIGKIAPPRKKHTPLEKYPQGRGINHRGDPGKIPPGTGENSYPSNNTTENTNNHTENKDDMSLSGESDAPAPIDFTEQKKKRDTEPRISAVSSHSQADIGNEETVKMPAIPKQTPAPGVPAIPPHGSDISAQAPIVSPSGDAAQRTAIGSGGAVQASIPKRPRGKVTQAKPAIVLSAQEQAFWDLWRGVWFNLDIPPDLTETAYGHVKKLAPFITTSEQLTSLIDFTRKDLAASQNIKRKMVQLGNMVHCYAGWKQAQQQPANNISKNGTDLNQYGLQALLQRQEQKAV